MRTATKPTMGVVLHVEDDQALAASVRTLLQMAGYEAATACDGAEAMRLIIDEHLRPDVLIVDFLLPGGMSGTDVAEEICHSLGYPIPTIILSAELSNAEVPWMPGAPILPLAKPVSPDFLLTSVAAFADLQHHMRLLNPRRPLTR